MAQQTKISSYRARSYAKDPSTNPLNDESIFQIEKKVHVNVLLEGLSYRIVGFVLMSQTGATLFDIRECIKSQFDRDQLELLGDGDSFKFVMDSAPISKKQETSITFTEIVISDEEATKLLQQYTAGGSFPVHLSDTSDDNDHDDMVYEDMTHLSRQVSQTAPNSRKNSCDIPYESVPHHYQYINNSNPSPVYHLVVPSTPNIRKIYDDKREKRRQKRIMKQRSAHLSHHIQTGLVSPLQLSPQSSAKSVKKRIRKQSKSRSRAASTTQKRRKTINTLWVPHKIREESDTKQENTSDMKHYSIIVRNVSNVTIKTGLFRTLSLKSDTKEDTNAPMSIFSKTHPMEPDAETNDGDTQEDSDFSTSSETTIDGRMEHMDGDYQPKQTRLEQQFGGRLPTIRVSKRTKNIESSDHIENILANALVDEQFKLKPMKYKRKTVQYPILPTQPLHDKINAMDHMLVPLVEADEEPMDDTLLRDDRCRFTVVGYALHENKQRMWMFYDPSELILGLQGVQHSESHPVWMDLVCDEETFVMISEHIRPTIHTLSIEDCITPECREKLEMFDHYLFGCIHTSAADKLCMIVFKGMIVTYHTDKCPAVDNMEDTSEDITDIVITEVRNRLERRHKNQCPSPGWVVHTIIDVIVDRMIPEVECRVQEVQNVENLVFALSGSSHDELLQRLQIARNWLQQYRSRLWPKSTMTHNFINVDWRRFLDGVQGNFWNDINDHVARMVDLLSIGEQTLESCQNIFVAKISLEMANQSNDLSDGASRLTALGSIFLPLSFLSAVWGMNCKVPFQYEGPDPEIVLFSDDYYGFMICFVFMMVVAYLTYRYHMKFV